MHDKIRAVLAERVGEVGSSLSGADKLSATLGLSSLDLAFLVAELEAELGVDPFAKLVSITSVRSVGDLVQAYQQAFFSGARARPAGRDDRDSGQASADAGGRGGSAVDRRERFRGRRDRRYRLPFSGRGRSHRLLAQPL